MTGRHAIRLVDATQSDLVDLCRSGRLSGCPLDTLRCVSHRLLLYSIIDRRGCRVALRVWIRPLLTVAPEVIYGALGG